MTITRTQDVEIVILDVKYTNKEIADKLHLSTATIKNRFYNLRIKYNVRTNGELLVLFLKQGWIKLYEL